MNSTITPVPHDLYDLGPAQRAYYDTEDHPSRRESRKLGPYPVTAETAALVEFLQRHYVLPWNLVHDRHLAMWMRDSLIGLGAWVIPLFIPFLMTDVFKMFRRVGEARKFWAGTDYRHGFSNVTDAEYEGILARYQAAAAAIALEEPVKAGAAIYLPELPFGPSALRYIPLVKLKWLDLEALVLAEAGALLVKEGMLRLPPAECRSLAWDRFYRDDTNWSNPKPIRPETIAATCMQARANISRCPGRVHTIGDRQFIDVRNYALMRGRYVRGRLEDRRVEGLHGRAWNAWIDSESDTGWVEIGPRLFGRVDHPCPLHLGRDYEIVPGEWACREALARRESALAELRDQPSSH